jgi:glucan phosphoethanolaminetransferase (alkaline phosphatase superfamily)
MKFVFFIAIVILVKGGMKSIEEKSIYDKVSSFRIIPLTFLNDLIKSNYNYNYKEEVIERDLAISKEHSWELKSVEKSSVNELKILIIGESTRRDLMSLYGFYLENTPFVSGEFGIFWDNFISPGTNTVSSLKYMLTFNEDGVIEANNNIVTLAKSAGYNVVWLSNQGRLGIADSFVSAIANQSDKTYFLKKGRWDDNAPKTYDEQLLEYYDDYLQDMQDKPTLIVFHLMGSHTPFCRNQDDQLFNYKNTEMSCYIQSVYNSDALLENIIERTKREKKQYSMIYFSDHGLVSSKGSVRIRHGLAKERFDVPLFMLGSALKERKTISGFKNGHQFIFGLSEWLGIQTVQGDTKPSLFDDTSEEPTVISGGKYKSYFDYSSDGFVR